MGKENFLARFRTALTKDDSNNEREAAEFKRQQEEIKDEERRLLLEFDNVIKPKLEERERTFLQDEPVSLLLGLFEEVASTIQKRECEKTRISMEITFDIPGLRYHKMGENLGQNDEDRLEFSRKIDENKEIEENIRTAVNGVHINFKGPKNIDFGFGFDNNTNTVRWHIGNAWDNVELDKLDLNFLSDLLAERVSRGSYIYTPPTKPDSQGGWN